MQVIEQLFAGEGLAGAAGEQMQQFEFVGGEFDGIAVERDEIFFRVDFKPANANDAGRFDLATGSAEQRAHTRHQRARRRTAW